MLEGNELPNIEDCGSFNGNYHKWRASGGKLVLLKKRLPNWATLFPYLATGKREGVRIEALFAIGAAVAIAAWWVSMLTGGMGNREKVKAELDQKVGISTSYPDPSRQSIQATSILTKKGVATMTNINESGGSIMQKKPTFTPAPTERIRAAFLNTSTPAPTPTPAVLEVYPTPTIPFAGVVVIDGNNGVYRAGSEVPGDWERCEIETEFEKTFAENFERECIAGGQPFWVDENCTLICGLP